VLHKLGLGIPIVR